MISSRGLLPVVWFLTTRDHYFDGASVSHCGRETCRCSDDNYSRRRHPKYHALTIKICVLYFSGHGLLQVLPYTTASRIEGGAEERLAVFNYGMFCALLAK
ncbi:hypothetical protein Bca52824_092437 [Brassica carinata]|uniref:Uncharacterized protein n=1 Tax=Brassica carinata TaxID=52824 RepID=A0A8X7NQR3_BRACI|nr:hypothetical protein Bca52824_092437 [Brassica carinata]